jgi:type IX secretion system PorP/SprF family membrane protein
MILRRLLLLVVCISTLGGLKAQDLHYTLFNLAPLKLNPANTGAFYGTVRAGGIFRDQWYSFVDDEYRTPTFSLDAPIIRGFRDNDWVGAGVQFINDKVGAGNLRTSGVLMSASYHLALDKKATRTLTLGLQGGSMSRKLDLQNLRAGDFEQGTLDGTGSGQTVDPLLSGGGMPGGGNDPNQGDLNATYLDINGGLLYKAKDPKAGTQLELGLAIGHINQGDDSFGGGGGSIMNPPGGGNNNQSSDSQRPMSVLAHGRYLYPVNDLWSAEPAFLFQTTSGGKNNIILQGVAGYQFNPQIKFKGGLGYRVGDSAQILLGAVIDESLEVGLSYDINLSPLSGVSNYQGGFEIGATYIIKIYKQPEIPPTIICPRL